MPTAARAAWVGASMPASPGLGASPRTAARESRATVTVYSTGSACVRCALTCRRLDEAGLSYRVVDLADPDNAAAREYLTEDLGYSEAPVCIVDDDPQHHWSGFRPDLIDALAHAQLGRVS